MPPFNLREQILKEHSKAQCASIVHWVGASQQRFNELFHLFLNDEYRVVQRAAWPVSNCVIAYPDFIKKNWSAFTVNLQKTNLHNSVKRNSIRMLQDIIIPKKYQGQIMEICFNYVQNPNEAVTVKAFSLTVLSNLAQQYPEIIPEIKFLIVEQIDHQTAAFKSRAKVFFKKFEK